MISKGGNFQILLRKYFGLQILLLGSGKRSSLLHKNVYADYIQWN